MAKKKTTTKASTTESTTETTQEPRSWQAPTISQKLLELKEETQRREAELSGRGTIKAPKS